LNDVCDCDPTRRRFLGAIGAAAVGAAALSAGGMSAGALTIGGSPSRSSGPVGEPGARMSATPMFGGLQILPRDGWGADLPPKGPLYPEDPLFVLVHHTASPNDGRDPREIVRISHAYHTGPKGWPDIAYNFMIGHDGSVWETRAGSLAGPVIADASGGSQGFAQLICMIGDFAHVAPPPAMQESLVRLVAFLAHRDAIDLTAGAGTSFISRGSDRFAAGTPMTVRTVSGHRDCTFTTCPGDVGYSLIPGWQARAKQLLDAPPSRFEHAERLGPPSS
jgi:hypothetical protein